MTSRPPGRRSQLGLIAVGILAVCSVVCCRRDDAVSGAQAQRALLLKRISRSGDVNDPTTPRPLVTLEEFFEGNADFGSIGYDLDPNPPAPAELYGFFKTIRAKPTVADARVEISQHDDPDAWPVSDTIWIVTSEPRETVARWLGTRFVADELLDGFPPDRRYEPLKIPGGMHAVGIWWD